MIINKHSTIVSLIQDEYNNRRKHDRASRNKYDPTKVKTRSKMLLLMSTYCVIAYKTTKGVKVSINEIASIISADRQSVMRYIKFLVENKMIEKVTGKPKLINGKIRKPINKYELHKDEYEVFKQINKEPVEFSSIVEFFMQKKTTKQKYGYRKTKYHCPKCLMDKVVVNRSQTKGLCACCGQGYTLDSVKWYDYHNTSTSIFKTILERIKGKLIEVNYIV